MRTDRVRRPSLGDAVWIVAPATASLIMLAATARHGPALSPDSAAYLSTSQNLLSGDGLSDYSGHALVTFPPGFPLLVSAVAWLFGSDVVSAARAANLLLLAAIVCLGYALVRRHVESHALRFVGVTALVAAPPLIEVTGYAWSEPLFIACTLAGLLALEELLDRPRHAGWLIATAVLISLAFLARYLGVALGLTAVLALLLHPHHSSGLRERVSRAGILAGLASVVPLVLVIRNVVVSSTPFGEARLGPDVSLARQIWATAAEIARWLFPRAIAQGPRIAAAVCVAALVAGVTLKTRHSIGERSIGRRSSFPLLLFSVIYLVLLEVSAAFAQIDEIGARFLSPLFVPGLIISLAAIDTACASALQSDRRFLGAALAAAVGCWATADAFAGRDEARIVADGAAYTSARWRDSPLAERLRDSPPSGILYSNQPSAVWATTRLKSRCPPPQLGEDLCMEVGLFGYTEDLAPLLRGQQHAYLAWFSEGAGNRRLLPRRGVRFRVIAKEADGTLYAIGR